LHHMPSRLKKQDLSNLESSLKNIIKGRTVLILCVGNQARGDDGASHLLLKKLKGRVVKLRLLDCGTSPQDCIGDALAFKPSVIILVNSLDHSLAPGSIVLDELHWGTPSGSSLIGHKVPLTWIASILKVMGQERNLAIETFLIGIQIRSTRGRLSTPVRRSVQMLFEIFARLDSMTEAFASQNMMRESC
jgi:hydrogenase maturation protease